MSKPTDVRPRIPGAPPPQRTPSPPLPGTPPSSRRAPGTRWSSGASTCCGGARRSRCRRPSPRAWWRRPPGGASRSWGCRRGTPPRRCPGSGPSGRTRASRRGGAGHDRQRPRAPQREVQRGARVGVRHVYARPFSPRRDGKVERMNQTLAREWQYARARESEASRADAPRGPRRPQQLGQATQRLRGPAADVAHSRRQQRLGTQQLGPLTTVPAL